MAGAGYKLFTTGSVLTAAEVNTYLNEQTVMVFNDATARTTALSGVLAEGMVTYLKSTKVVEIYNGTAWASLDDPNAIQNTIVDAKGDLISASGNDVPARLAVGNNGETLVADSSTSTGLRWQGNFAAGKNAIINGDFRIWQRGTSFSVSNGASPIFTADRFAVAANFSAGTTTASQQTFTPGTAPVAGYEGAFFHRLALGSTATYYEIFQKIEDVRTFAGQTITVSFWAKASSSTTTKTLLRQNFGSGGSANVDYLSTASLTTSWQRFTWTLTLGSLSGKTIGTNSFLQFYLYQDTGALGGLSIDLWGIQIEAGNTATAFQTATGTLAGELAACQRYYWRTTSTAAFSSFALALVGSAVKAYPLIDLPVTMRVTPTSLDIPSTITRLKLTDIAANNYTISAITIDPSTPDALTLNVTSSGMTQQNILVLSDAGGNNSFIGVSAEL